MMRTAMLLVAAALCFLSFGTVNAQDGAYTLDHVDGLVGPNQLGTDAEITFHIRMNNNTGYALKGITNGFRVYSTNGAQWTTTVPDTTGAITSAMFDAPFIINTFSITGSGADTVGFGGFKMFAPGIPAGFNEITYTIMIGPIAPMYNGGTIVLDSSFYPPISFWKQL
jgi:hypothetical protein